MNNYHVIVLIFGLINACAAPNGSEELGVVSSKEYEPGNLIKEKDTDLILIVNAGYTASIGWGHGFKCTVIDIVKGQFTDSEFALFVYGQTDPPSLASGDHFHPAVGKKIPRITLGFCKRPDIKHGPPEGFRDSQGTYWELIFAK
jgi:hypothetical protein